MKQKTESVFYISTVVFLLILSINCQFYDEAQSPCPGLFTYQSDGNTIYGYITIKSSGGFVSNVHLRANFTIAARLPTTYIGQIEGIGHDLLQKFNRGMPLRFRVHFPVISPLPRLTSIVANGQPLCYGPADVPGPNQYVTTLSLNYMLYLKVSNPYVHNRFEPSETELDFEEHFGDNIQDFNTNDENRDVSWSSAVQPTRPNYEKPRPRPNRPRPEYTQSQPNPDYNMYYTDYTTQATRPVLTTPAPPVKALPSAPPRFDRPAAPVECGVIAGGNEQVPLIFNGNSYPRGDWPWLVVIYKRQEGSLTFICAGTLVSERHVVTAAHCMHQKSRISKIKDIVVKVGVYNLEDWGDEISVTRTLQTAQIHESYNATTLENDIIILTMEKKVEFNNYIRPACLWRGNTDLNRIVGASGVVAGWGQSEVGPVGHGEPRVVRIPVVSTSTCRASKPEFHKLTSSNTLCAGDRMGSGPCLGDSGGGLYILDNGRWRLRGIVSLSLRPPNGEGTCNLNEYIIFTDTAKYLTWINKYISQNLFDF